MTTPRLSRRTAVKAASATFAMPYLAGSAFTNRAAAQGSEIRFASWLGAAAGLVDVYNQSQGDIRVTYEEIPFEQYADRLLIDMASGTAPDVFHWPSPWWISAMRKGVFLPLNERLAADGIELSEFVYDPMRVGGMDGELYGLPYALPTTRVIIYNKRLFEEAGAALPEEGWTWDDMVEAAKLIHNPPDVYAIPFPPHQLNIETMIFDNGGGVISEDGTTCLLNEPASVAALQESVNWYREDQITMEPGQEESLGEDPFASDKLAMAYISIPGWQSWNRYTRDLTIDADVVRFPKAPGGAADRTAAEAHMIAIPASTENADLAWEFLKWSQTNEDALNYWIEYYPVNYHFEEYIQTVPEGRQREITSLRYDFRETLEVTYWGPNTTESQRAFTAEYELAVLGEKPVQEAMDAACDEIQSLLDSGS